MDNSLPKENPMLFICGPLFLGFVGELHFLLVAPEFSLSPFLLLIRDDNERVDRPEGGLSSFPFPYPHVEP